MQIILKNIGIIKEAKIDFNGLSVIAGENDSGKSTVSKVLYALIKTIRYAGSVGDSQDKERVYIDKFNRYILKLFKNQISKDGAIFFRYKGSDFDIKIKNNRCISFAFPKNYKNDEPKIATPLFIDTPYIWNLLPSLKTMKNLDDIDFEIMETLKDLYSALNIKLSDENKIKLSNITSLINGEFQEDELGNFLFKKENQNIEIINTAMGIKYFGIFQVLSDKNHFYNTQILFLDEPEVHLHPKWQLELAKLIVHLVAKGVKILVNSHSPYMIEALQRYAQKENIPNSFYLADNRKIMKDSQSLSKIFAKLSEPFDEFDKMDSELLNG